MLTYLRKFDTRSEYEEYYASTSFTRPNISSIVEEIGEGEIGVEFNPTQHDYSQDYLTFVAKGVGTFTFSGSSTANTLSYSLDGGTTWSSPQQNVTTPTVQPNDKVLWNGSSMSPDSTSGIGKFSSSCYYHVEGNAMSLLFGDNFASQTSLDGYSNAYNNLFYGSTLLMRAENLSLPATTLAPSCYNSMFKNCSSLKTAPKLIATTLTGTCYQYMFMNCTSLEKAPELPALTLPLYCYNGMFNGCTKLNYIKSMNTSSPSLISTLNWVKGVAANGTFVKNSAASWENTFGINAIPEGWTVITASA